MFSRLGFRSLDDMQEFTQGGSELARVDVCYYKSHSSPLMFPCVFLPPSMPLYSHGTVYKSSTIASPVLICELQIQPTSRNKMLFSVLKFR